MKKTYVKPKIFYEKFEISQNIAACGWDVNSVSLESCGAVGDSTNFNNPPIVIYMSTEICDVQPNDVEDYCYETGNDDNRTFNS